MEEKINKLLEKKNYLKWYNLAKEEIGDSNLIPERTQEEIFKLVSRKNWLMFCAKGINREEAIQFPEPNIFFNVFVKEYSSEGVGSLGLTFNNLGAYEKFKTIMRGLNKETKEKIIKKLLELKYKWKITIKKKIKEKHSARPPKNYDYKEWDTKQINEDIIDELIKTGDKIIEEGKENKEKIREKSQNPKKFYCETPLIDLMEAEFILDEKEFKERILEIFEVLSLCLGVKSNVEINKIVKEKIKRIEEITNSLYLIEKEVNGDEKMFGVIKGVTKETIKLKKDKIKVLKEERENLQKEVKG